MTQAGNNSQLKAVNIMIVDDHRLFADGLGRLLETLDRPVKLTRCYTAQQAIDQLEINRFDLLLADLHMPDIDGLGLLQAINVRQISTPVAMVSSTEDIQMIGHLMKNGAIGFIPKSASSESMLEAVSTLLSGNIYLPDDLWDRLDILSHAPIENISNPSPSKYHAIGFRQLEVLELMAQGRTNKQISTILAISEATVKYHVGILFRSLNVKNRTACINAALPLNLIKSTSLGTHA